MHEGNINAEDTNLGPGVHDCVLGETLPGGTVPRGKILSRWYRHICILRTGVPHEDGASPWVFCHFLRHQICDLTRRVLPLASLGVVCFSAANAELDIVARSGALAHLAVTLRHNMSREQLDSRSGVVHF